VRPKSERSEIEAILEDECLPIAPDMGTRGIELGKVW
jgi:hypothetical protein